MYGVISFYAVLQGLIIFADAGLTATLRRELASVEKSLTDREKKFKIFRSIEFVYLLLMSVIILSLFFSSDFIVQHWLDIEDLDVQETREGIQLMGFALGLNFFSTLYQGGLLGLERQVLSNTIQITWGLLKNGGVILGILFIGKTLFVFFMWQIGANLLYTIILRYFLVKQLKQGQHWNWKLYQDIIILKTVWKYATGMLVISIIAAITTQFDKLIISKFFSISDLAVYNVAYSLAMAPVILSGPIAVAIFPRLVAYSTDNKQDQLSIIFNNSFVLVLLLSSTVGIVLMLYADFFLNVWTQNAKIASLASYPAGILLIAQMLLSYQVIPFNLALAKGNTRINIKMGLIGLIILIPLTILFSRKYGIEGTAFSWLITSFIITPIYIGVVLKRLTVNKLSRWFIAFLLKPLALIILGNVFFYNLRPTFVDNSIFSLIYIAISASIVLLLSFNISFKIKFKNTLKFIQYELFA